VPAKDVQAHPVDLFELLGTGFGELSRDAPHLDDRYARRVGQCDGHLQDDLQLVTDRVRRTLLERFGAVARLEQEGLAVSDECEVVEQSPGLAGKDEWRFGGELGFDAFEVRSVGPGGTLGDRA